MTQCIHQELSLIIPDSDSKLTSLIIELEELRKKEVVDKDQPMALSQLKKFFHAIESVGSAQIEGNTTTILDYLELKKDTESKKSDSFNEIKNIEETLEFIEENIDESPINRMFIAELHQQVVNGLIREGSKSEGEYRKHNISISGSGHTPPDFTRVADYMDELFTFINEKHHEKYNLIKVAIAHHRFTWVHPFDNGNGRTVRLLTYAMLMQQGFFVGKEKIINPTAIFCMDREKYYSELSKADTGTKQGMLSWCEYILVGLKKGIEEVHLILNNDCS